MRKTTRSRERKVSRPTGASRRHGRRITWGAMKIVSNNAHHPTVGMWIFLLPPSLIPLCCVLKGTYALACLLILLMPLYRSANRMHGQEEGRLPHSAEHTAVKPLVPRSTRTAASNTEAPQGATAAHHLSSFASSANLSNTGGNVDVPSPGGARVQPHMDQQRRVGRHASANQPRSHRLHASSPEPRDIGVRELVLERLAQWASSSGGSAPDDVPKADGGMPLGAEAVGGITTKVGLWTADLTPACAAPLDRGSVRLASVIYFTPASLVA
jgi:hypothetical protein